MAASGNGETSLPETWAEMRLDTRIEEAIRALAWRKPTTVQRACVPHMLRGNDVAVQSRTGSGKTGAFAVPLVQRLLTERAMKAGSRPAGPTGLILVPSVELCEQTTTTLESVARYLKPRANIENLGARGTSAALTTASGVDFIVATPAALAKLLRSGVCAPEVLQGLRVLVIDEADLLVSTTSLRVVQSMLPATGLQTVLLSATLTEGVATIKGQMLRNPTTFTLSEEDDEGSRSGPAGAGAATPAARRAHRAADADADGDVDDVEVVVDSNVRVRENNKSTLRQFSLVATDGCHKHTLLYALLRLNVIEGKTLIFVDDEEETYRLQHFLEQLKVSTIVYDAQLPQNVRVDMLRRFQRGEVLTMICTDGTLEKAERVQLDVSEEDKESGLHRGVDFNKVRNVIIFDGIDSPSALNFAAYTHRVGRTGRAGQPGTSVIIMPLVQAQRVLGPLREYVKGRGQALRPFKKVDRDRSATLQYRVDSVLANVTRTATKRLRVATVASELARSKVLSSRLNAGDNAVLRKIVGKAKKAVRSDPNILTVPSYMGLKADGNADYRDRVKAGAPMSKERTFSHVTKRPREDPVRSLLAKVRRIGDR